MSNQAAVLEGFGGPDRVRIEDVPVPRAGRGEVRVRVLASSIQFTDTVIRRHRYPQLHARPPFVLGYDVVGEIDEVGPGVEGLRVGDRVADLTVTGSNVEVRTLRADRVTPVPPGVDAAEAATLVLSWTTAYQLLHRVARVHEGDRVLVLGAAGAVGQALVVLARRAGLEVWGTAHAEDVEVVRELGATPIAEGDAIEGTFDAVFDGLGVDGYRSSWRVVAPGGVLCAYGFSAAIDRSSWIVPAWIARLYLWGATSPDRRARFYSIGAMRARHPDWFREDLGALFAMLARDEIRPRVAERISFEGVRDAHRRLEEMRLRGKIVLCPGGTTTA